jgi:ribosomal protein S18 acetylase RimI-like enzyme
MATITRLTRDRASDDELVRGLVDVVNRAFYAGDEGLWSRDIAFTSPDELRSWVAADEMVAAFAPTPTNEHLPVGAIRTRSASDLNTTEAWFGTLTVDPGYGGRGIGRQLVDHVEAEASANGRTVMNIEALIADPPHEGLERIFAWYQRRGYREVGRQDPSGVFPEFMPFALTTLDIIRMQKPLLPSR